jgi:hypothetical protein
MGGVMAFGNEIAAGMDLLDRWFNSKSWVTQIDVGDLDLSSGCNCVLGQLAGDYDTMCDELEISEGESMHYGFTIPHTLDDPRPPDVQDLMWHKLTEEWVEAIKDRLNEGIEL